MAHLTDDSVEFYKLQGLLYSRDTFINATHEVLKKPLHIGWNIPFGRRYFSDLFGVCDKYVIDYILANNLLAPHHLAEVLHFQLSYHGCTARPSVTDGKFTGMNTLENFHAADHLLKYMLAKHRKYVINTLIRNGHDYPKYSTILHGATYKIDRYNWFYLIRDAGGDVLLADTELAPIHYLIRNLHIKQVKRAFAANQPSLVTSVINNHKTPVLIELLDIYRFTKRIKVLRKLKTMFIMCLEHGADVNQVDRDGRNLSDYIETRGYRDLFGPSLAKFALPAPTGGAIEDYWEPGELDNLHFRIRDILKFMYVKSSRKIKRGVQLVKKCISECPEIFKEGHCYDHTSPHGLLETIDYGYLLDVSVTPSISDLAVPCPATQST